jgi:hypothetical protein
MIPRIGKHVAPFLAIVAFHRMIISAKQRPLPDRDRKRARGNPAEAAEQGAKEKRDRRQRKFR